MRKRKINQYLLALAFVAAGLCFDAQAATATNAFVTVSSSTDGVESIVPVGADFYITTRNVSKPSFRADITVVANSPYYLISTLINQNFKAGIVFLRKFIV